MRLITNKTTGEIVGIIPDNSTSHLPPSSVDENTEFIDVDCSDGVKTKTAELFRKERHNLLGKKLTRKGRGFGFNKMVHKIHPTVLIRVKNPKFHKDVSIYVKKAEEKGAYVEFVDNKTMTIVYIRVNKEEVGKMIFVRQGCCTYLYQSGTVFNRDYYPHYLGLYKFWELVKDRVSYIDMGGLTKTDKGLNDFKKKWGDMVTEDYRD